MKSIQYLALPLLAASLVMTGCASRKPAATVESGTNPNSATTVNTSGLSEDAALNAQNLNGASSKGVTEANKAEGKNYFPAWVAVVVEVLPCPSPPPPAVASATPSRAATARSWPCTSPNRPATTPSVSGEKEWATK